MQVVPPPVDSVRSETPTPTYIARVIAQAFLILLVLLIVNEAMFIAGLPAWRSSQAFGKYPIGTDGLVVSSWVAVAVCALALVARRLQGGVFLLCLGVVGLLVPGVFSLALHEGPGVGRSAALVVTSVGVVVAAVVAGARFLTWLAFVAGGLVAWLSLLLGVASMTFWESGNALEADTSGRYGRWLGPLGEALDADRFGALIGVAPSRQTLGPVMAMLLVIQVVTILRLRLHQRRPWVLLAPIASTLALLWSMSRTGILGALVGIVVSLLPWNRLRSAYAVALISGATLLAWAVPFLSAVSLENSFRPRGTFEWRRALWAAYLEDDGLFSMFGIGAQAPPPLGAGHAHNLLVESIANGGQLGFLGLVAFVLVAVFVSVMARHPFQSIAVGVWGVVAVAGALELPVTVRQISLSMLWLVVLCTLGLAASKPKD